MRGNGELERGRLSDRAHSDREGNSLNPDDHWLTLGRLVHDFRRTAVHPRVRASVPDQVAMELTGHRTRSTFERYARAAGFERVDILPLNHDFFQFYRLS